jgi:hypothetical protein
MPIEHKTSGMLVETYLTHEELFGRRSTADEFRAELLRFPSDMLIRVCSTVNILLFGWSKNLDKDLHDRLVQMLCPTALGAIKRAQFKIFVHRELLLLVAKETLRNGPRAPSLPTATPELTRLFLMAGDRLADALPGERGARNAVELISRFLPISEFQFAHPAIRLSRAFVMLGKLAELMPEDGKQFDVPKMFEKATGIAPDIYFPLVMACMTKYLEYGQEQMPQQLDFVLRFDWFNNTNLKEEQLQLFFDDLSADYAEYQKLLKRFDRGVSDFTIFRERPIVRIDGGYLPVDFGFLASKAESAFFWRAQSSLPSAEKESFHAFWGTIFERYMHRLLKRAASTVNQYFESPYYADRRDEQVCDGIILCKGYAVFIELKGSLFRADAKWAGDATLLAREIRTKLVGEDGGDRKGVTQLASAISSVFEHKRPVAGVDLSKVTKVYPVLVTYDEIGDAWFLASYLNEEFKNAVNRKKMGVTVTPAFCISADQLERLCGVFQSVALSDILDGRYKQDKSLEMPFGLPNNPALKGRQLVSGTLEEGSDELLREAARLFPNGES